MNRKITFDQKKEPPIERIVLKKVIGFAGDGLGILITEDTITGEWEGRYLSTGAILELKNKQLPVNDWGRDLSGNQIEEVKKIYEFIKPPPKKQEHHAETCGCNDCKELRKVKEIMEKQNA